MLCLLLDNGGARAKVIVEQYEPMFDSFRAFLDYQDSIFRNGNRITYNDNGTATVEL